MTTLRDVELPTGEVLGDYEVIDLLGFGPTGTTYHVMSHTAGKQFVLKALRLLPETSPEWLLRLEAQTALLIRIKSQHIDSIVNTGRTGSWWFVLKDFVHDGEGAACDLRSYTSRHGGRLSHYQALQVGLQLTNALTAALNYEDTYHHGICHGNLKPENILMGYCEDNELFELKITDFQPYGLMDRSAIVNWYRLREQALSFSSPINQDNVRTQLLLSLYRGYDYQPPEYNDTPPTARGDVFSCGVILYQLLTGKIPTGRFEAPTKILPELPEAWDGILTRCLSQRPELRYADAKELFAALKTLCEETAEEVSPTPTATPQKERTSLTPRGMVYIPAGTYSIGSIACGQDAIPVHNVSTTGYYLDRAPVTNAAFARFVKETGYVTEMESGEGGPVWLNGQWKIMKGICWSNPTEHRLPSEFEKHPVTQVTYNDALAYCGWIGRRLPTEEEWEIAARGGLAGEPYPWGKTITRNQANYSSDGTTPVMRYSANGYGLYDMVGNVWEWTSSWYMPYPGNRESSPHYGETYRIVRGGCWMYDAPHCQVAVRNATMPDATYPTVGFRTAADYQR